MVGMVTADCSKLYLLATLCVISFSVPNRFMHCACMFCRVTLVTVCGVSVGWWWYVWRGKAAESKSLTVGLCANPVQTKRICMLIQLVPGNL